MDIVAEADFIGPPVVGLLIISGINCSKRRADTNARSGVVLVVATGSSMVATRDFIRLHEIGSLGANSGNDSSPWNFSEASKLDLLSNGWFNCTTQGAEASTRRLPKHCSRSPGGFLEAASGSEHQPSTDKTGYDIAWPPSSLR